MEFDFKEWGKLQMALAAGGSEHMNVLASESERRTPVGHLVELLFPAVCSAGGLDPPASGTRAVGAVERVRLWGKPDRRASWTIEQQIGYVGSGNFSR